MMTLTAAKRSLASSDPVLFARAYTALKAEGHTDGALYRLAKAVDGTLTQDEWSDRVKNASEAAR